MKTIEITINPTGETKVETRGFSGASCRDASRFLEGARRPRPEFHQSETAENRLHE